MKRVKQNTKPNETKKEKKNISFLSKISYFGSCVAASLIITTPVYAASYLDPINKLKTVFLSIVAAGGVIVLIFGGMKFAEAFQKKDQNGEYSAIYTIIAGGIMIGISAFVAALT